MHEIIGALRSQCFLPKMNGVAQESGELKIIPGGRLGYSN